jgi:hypothetical protein
MTATLNSDGHIILPPEIHRAVQAHPARQFDAVVSTSGVIMLRPERKPSRTLVESFAALRGLEMERRRDPIPEPPEL